MAHVLITFLGRASKPGPNGRPARGYQTASYDFGDSIREAQFFGLALAEKLCPDRIVIAGTRGSMWDVLLDSLDLDETASEKLLELADLAWRSEVDAQLLTMLEPEIGQCLGVPTQLLLIPEGVDTAEQISLLGLLADNVPPESDVSLDITHGLRSLPLLVMISALYLRAVRKVRVKGIHYGAFELRHPDGRVPVIDLGGLLSIADGTAAFAAFEHSGDYARLAPVFTQGGQAQLAAELEQAAFAERTFRPTAARKPLSAALLRLNASPSTGVAGLFAEPLAQRISWCQEDRLYRRQRELAYRHLDDGDYLRATLVGYEAFILMLMHRYGLQDTESYEQREQAKQRFKEEMMRSSEIKNAYSLLKDIRNRLAHGTRPDGRNAKKIDQTLNDAKSLATCLRECFTVLLSDVP